MESKQTSKQIDFILRGTYEQDDISLLRDLGATQSKVTTLRLEYLVNKLIFHQFGNYGRTLAILTLCLSSAEDPLSGEG